MIVENSLLRRQLKKLGLAEDRIPDRNAWGLFLDKVEHAYESSDQERYLLERSLTISSKEMREVYEQLKTSEKRYALAAQGANDGLWDWDLENDTAYYSSRWAEILGITPIPDQIPSKKSWLERIHPDDYENVVGELNRHIDGETEHFENEHRVLHRDGNYRWVLSRGLAVRDGDGRAYRLAGSLTDITSRKVAEKRLAHEAVHDSLTGLPNRAHLMDKLSKKLILVREGLSPGFSVLFVDLDRFKVINDSLGHQAGDILLKEISSRLGGTIRPSDMVARLGGDEFVIVIDNARDRSDIELISKRVIDSVEQPITVDSQRLYTSASIGIVEVNEKYNSADDIVRDADFAMYRAKAKGKGRFEFFDNDKHSNSQSLLMLELGLRDAIEECQFVLNYQPIVSVIDERIIGFESLIRWNHPEKGFVSPADFIPVAEDTGLIVEIGEWVLNESCRQLKEWQAKTPNAQEMIVSVNLSAKQLEDDGLIDTVARALSSHKMNASSLKLEITESAIMTNADSMIERVTDLRELGVLLSIDDFGTGYSSLSYLHKFPVDTLKVDRSFISRIGVDKENSEIVATIIGLGESLGMKVVAEGVETIEQTEFLQSIKCDYAQGFYWSKPLEQQKALRLIDTQLPPSRPRDNSIERELGTDFVC